MASYSFKLNASTGNGTCKNDNTMGDISNGRNVNYTGVNGSAISEVHTTSHGRSVELAEATVFGPDLHITPVPGANEIPHEVMQFLQRSDQLLPWTVNNAHINHAIRRERRAEAERLIRLQPRDLVNGVSHGEMLALIGHAIQPRGDPNTFMGTRRRHILSSSDRRAVRRMANNNRRASTATPPSRSLNSSRIVRTLRRRSATPSAASSSPNTLVADTPATPRHTGLTASSTGGSYRQGSGRQSGPRAEKTIADFRKQAARQEIMALNEALQVDAADPIHKSHKLESSPLASSRLAGYSTGGQVKTDTSPTAATAVRAASASCGVVPGNAYNDSVTVPVEEVSDADEVHLVPTTVMVSPPSTRPATATGAAPTNAVMHGRSASHSKAMSPPQSSRPATADGLPIIQQPKDLSGDPVLATRTGSAPQNINALSVSGAASKPGCSGTGLSDILTGWLA